MGTLTFEDLTMIRMGLSQSYHSPKGNYSCDAYGTSSYRLRESQRWSDGPAELFVLKETSGAVALNEDAAFEHHTGACSVSMLFHWSYIYIYVHRHIHIQTYIYIYTERKLMLMFMHNLGLGCWRN